MVLGIVFIVVWLVAAVVVGLVTGGQTTPTNIDATNNDETDCDNACQQWETRRIESCQARSQVNTFQSMVDETRNRLIEATAIHLALVAAAVAAAFIPIVGQVIAVGLAAAAVAALGVVHMFTGQLVSQTASLNQAKAIAMQAEQRESEARINIIKACPSDRANECINRPAPC